MSTLAALKGVGTVLHGRFLVTLPKPTTNTDLAQHIIIVTGANSGLGLESVRHLAELGVGKIVMAVRTPSKGETARQQVLDSLKNFQSKSHVEVWPLDMEDFSSIKIFADRAAQLPRLDGVLANAGIMTSTFSLSSGYEKTLTVNVLNAFLLYQLLLPTMLASKQRTGNPCRFSIPNSALHFMSSLKELQPPPESEVKSGGLMQRLSDPSKADMADRYNLSKLLVLFATRELAKRVDEKHGPEAVILNTPNPSYCVSDLVREQGDSVAVKVANKVMARSTEEGSRALVGALLAGRESHGEYLSNCKVAGVACFVTDENGQKAQKYFVDEMMREIERIRAGL